MNTIPIAALRQHLGILGTTGSGKSYSARGLVERLLDDGPELPRMLIVDPKGDWAGLRLKANGKDLAYSFTIIGGQYADPGLRLDPDDPFPMAKPIGHMIATTDCRVVLDLSDLGVGKMRAFVAALLQEIYHHNRNPLYLIVDEADEFAPQTSKGESAVALAAMERIWKRGRQRGIRGWMISQRPASIHKDVLGMVQTLIAMKLVLPHDRRAISEWMAGQEIKGDKTVKDLVDSLPSLKLGTGWVWSPGVGLLEKLTFPKIHTFDSMKTPEDGDVAAGVTLPAIDNSAVASALATAVKEKKDNDPKELKARISELEKRLAESHQVGMQPVDVDFIKTKAYSEGWADAVESSRLQWVPIVQDLNSTIKGLEAIRGKASHAINFHVDWPNGAEKRDDATRPALARDGKTPIERLPDFVSQATPAARVSVPPPARESARAGKDQELTGPSHRLLNAAAWWWPITTSPTPAMVAFVARIKPTGGHFSNSLGPLITGGYLDRNGEGLTLTGEGLNTADQDTAPRSLREYHERIKQVLKGRTGDIFRRFISMGNRAQTNEELGRAVGIDPGGGHFSNSIGPLSTLGLIERKNGTNHPTRLMFPEGLR